MMETDTRSVAEILGWKRLESADPYLQLFNVEGEDGPFFLSPDGLSVTHPSAPKPTLDDMLAWLRREWKVSIIVWPSTYDVGITRCDDVYVHHDMQRDTLYAALEVAVRAAAT